MKTRIFSLSTVLAVTALICSPASAATSTWSADPNHSEASFTATHLMISHVTGNIPIKVATLEIPEGSNIPTSVKAELDPKGIDTRNDRRDSDLRSAHFFEVDTYPKMTFESTKISKIDGTHFTLTGNLAMHGQTHQVTLQAEFLGRNTALKEPRIAYTAKTTIDRTLWGMNYGQVIASKDIDLTIDVEAVKQ